MYAEPAGFDRQALARLVETGWGVDVGQLAYAPVGFGTHHYTDPANEWFINVDEGEPARLRQALAAAAGLSEQGLEFVHAPMPNTDGDYVARMGRYVVSVFPYLRGESYPYGEYADPRLRAQVIAALGRMHRTPAKVLPRKENFAIPHRAQVFDRLEETWGSGPWGEPARRLVAASTGQIQALLDRFDKLVPVVRAGQDRWVITHGEPHAGNVMLTAAGIKLIDWDTTALGPRERDLWMIEPRSDEERAAYDTYEPDPQALALYRLWWDLSEICGYTAYLRAPHVEDDNTAVAWRALRDYLTSNSSSQPETGSPNSA